MTPAPDPFDFGSWDPNGSQNPSPAATDASFDDAPGSPKRASSAIAAPPVRWLVIAALFSLAAIALAAIASDTVAFAMLAWVLSGPMAIGALAWFTILDTRERAKPFYSSPGSARVLYGIALAFALIGVVAAAIRIALWAGRL